MTTKAMRIGIYTRVSTHGQNTANQLEELKAWAKRAGHDVVEVYEDKGISGAKGRDKRPAFDAVLRAAVRRHIDLIAVWSADRLGRSLPHLIEVLQTIRSTGTGLYIHTQSLDTTTPAGRALLGMLGVFAEFEREMIVARVNAGLDRARAQGVKLGRPQVGDDVEESVRAALAKGTGILKTAKLLGIGTSTVQRVKREMAGLSLSQAKQ